MTTRQPWHELAKDLVDVAMGRKHATMVIRNGRWVNVHSGEIIPNIDVAIYKSRIAYVGEDASSTIGEGTEVIEANGRYLIPGLCDAHMHVESGMVTVTEFARAVIPHGTTSMFIDPHEIANVLGLPGVKLMHDEAQTLPTNIYVQMPSCVPSAPGLETPGAAIGPAEVAEAMTWPGIIGLGEMMNFPGVFMSDDKMHAEMAETMKAGKVIGGHYASLDLGRPFHGYVAGGPADDHEGTRAVDAIARVRQGMKAMLRLGSAWYDVATQVKAITEMGLDSRNFILCTDDSHSGTLVHEGHMNRVVRHAIAQGLKPITAIQMATINTAEHFGLEKDIGSITPGRYADIVLTSNLEWLPIEKVIVGGKVLAKNGRLAVDLPPYNYPDFAKNTIKLGKTLTATDFNIPVSSLQSSVSTIKAKVIGVVENQAPTRALTRVLPVEKGLVQMDPAQDVCQIALVERHQATGGVTNGFVSGFGFNVPCAVATTVAHDSHHMLVLGTQKSLMAIAANRLAEIGGGVVVFKQGREYITISEKKTTPTIMKQEDHGYLRYLRRILTEKFDEGELRNLCFDLGVSYDMLPHEGTPNKARELLLYLDRRDNIRALYELGPNIRPDIVWNDPHQDEYVKPRIMEMPTEKLADIELALVELPIAGLMSDERAEIVADKAARMVEAMAECGCTLHNAYMQLSLLALVVIPELRISDLGLVDVTKFEVVDLFED